MAHSAIWLQTTFAVVIHTQADELLIDEVLGVGDALFHAKCLAEPSQRPRVAGTQIIVSDDLGTVRRSTRRCWSCGTAGRFRRPDHTDRRCIGGLSGDMPSHAKKRTLSGLVDLRIARLTALSGGLA